MGYYYTCPCIYISKIQTDSNRMLSSSIEVELATLHSQGLSKELQRHDQEKCSKTYRCLNTKANLCAFCMCPSDLEVTNDETTSSCKGEQD